MAGSAQRRTAPDPDALRRERATDQATWRHLPPRRDGDIPEWPIECEEPDVKELAVWNRLWRTPQAIIWEERGMHDIVAVYVRTWLFAMSRNARAPILTAHRQQAEKLLFDVFALRAARIIIDQEEKEPEIGDDGEIIQMPLPTRGPSARQRLAVAPVVQPDPEEIDDEDDEDEDSDGSDE